MLPLSLRRDDVAAQIAGVGLAGIIDQELRAGEAAVFGVVRSANGDVDLLARNGVFGDQNRIERAAVALRDQGAVEEDAAIVREPHRKPHARAADIPAADSGGDLDRGAIPGVAVAGCAEPPPPPPRPPVRVMAVHWESSSAGSSPWGTPSAAWARQAVTEVDVMAARRVRTVAYRSGGRIGCGGRARGWAWRARAQKIAVPARDWIRGMMTSLITLPHLLVSVSCELTVCTFYRKSSKGISALGRRWLFPEKPRRPRSRDLLFCMLLPCDLGKQEPLSGAIMLSFGWWQPGQLSF